MIKINGSEKKTVCKKYIVITYKLGFSDVGISNANCAKWFIIF